MSKSQCLNGLVSLMSNRDGGCPCIDLTKSRCLNGLVSLMSNRDGGWPSIDIMFKCRILTTPFLHVDGISVVGSRDAVKVNLNIKMHTVFNLITAPALKTAPPLTFYYTFTYQCPLDDLFPDFFLYFHLLLPT